MIRKVVFGGHHAPLVCLRPTRRTSSPWANDRSFPHRTKPTSLHGSKRETGRKPGGRSLPESAKRMDDRHARRNLFPPREIKIKATGQMPYVYLRVKTNFPEDRWIQATEVRPTAPEVVHHVLVFASGRMESKGNKPELWPPHVPGNTFVEFPPGVAKKLPVRGDSPFPDALYPDGESDYRPNANRTPLRKNPS